MTETKQVTRAEAAGLLRGIGRALILTHANPDADTLGSAFGLKGILSLLGCEAQCVCGSFLSPKLSFLCGGRTSLFPEQLPEGFSWDCVISVDVASPGQLGSLRIPFGEPGMTFLALDHHAVSTPFAEYTLTDASLASCSELVYDIGKTLFSWSVGSPAPQSIAAPLYAGLSADSGSLQFGSVTPKTHERAAELIASGIPHAEISHLLFGQKMLSEIRSEQLAYRAMVLSGDGTYADAVFTEQMMLENRLTGDDIANVANLLRGVEGVRVAAHFKPDGPDRFKVSMRSAPGINIADICSSYGGGGHFCAAGFSIDRSELDSVRSELRGKVLSLLEKAGQSR